VLLLFIISAGVFAMTSDLPPLRVMTLNVAHGRRDRFHQTLLFTSTIRTHLDEIADMIRRENPDIVALQEADGPCWWSGKFDHVQYIADKSGMKYCFRGAHVRFLGLNYGTAIISKLPLIDNESISFPSTWPSPPKGFVVSQVKWNDQDVDIISLHLDFLRANVQRQQVQVLTDKLKERNRPLIVMGDFNCDWDGTDSPLRMLCENLGLKAFRPKQLEGMGTFPVNIPISLHRLDWILLSSESDINMEFSLYVTIPDTLSDHLGIQSEIKMEK
jgi:endonuclease/exonuclease/phosphatase family metal-dependent hydrolase